MTHLRQWLEQGDFSLALSAGFFGFYSHCGFVKALLEEGYRPKAIMGSSAGALIGSLLASGQDSKSIEELLCRIQKKDFWDFKPGMGILEGQKFKKLLSQYLVADFNQLEIPLSVSTFEVKSLSTRSFQTGDLIEPVRASCCFPLLFKPVQIAGKYYMDGGITDWTGTKNPYYKNRTLVHFLKPDGFGKKIIIQSSFKRKTQNTFFFQQDESISMGPNRMHLASDAIRLSYAQTKKALQFT